MHHCCYLFIVVLVALWQSKAQNLRGVQTIQENSPKQITLQPLEKKPFSFPLSASTISKKFVILQAHTQYRTISISLTQQYNLSYSYSGSNAGIIFDNIPKSSKDVQFYVTSDAEESVQVQLAAVTFKSNSPIPGGCCLTCDLDNDPNLDLTYDDYTTTVSFSKANVYEQTECDSSMNPPEFRLSYNLYRLYIEEQSLDVSDMMSSLKKMYSVDSIKKYATKVSSLTTGLPSIAVDSNPGQGAIYTIVAEDPYGSSAAYVPVITYACNFTAKVDNCNSIVMYYSPSNVVIAILIILTGIFLSFCGHRFFIVTICIAGIVIYSCVFYIVFVNETTLNYTGRLWLCLFMGLSFGLLLLLLWCLLEPTMFFVFHNGLMFGFLMSSLLFYIPAFAELNFWNSNANYGVVFFSFVLVLPCLGLLFMKWFHILCTSVVGSYGIVVGIDYFLRSSLKYIILNVIRRAVGHGVYLSPFQYKDYILLVLWIILTVCGVIVQRYFSKNKPNFPKSPYLKKKQQQKDLQKRYENSLQNENLPILINYKQYGSASASETNIVC